MAFADSHFKNLAKVPPQVIDDGEGEAALCSLVQEVLKLVAANARQLTIPELATRWMLVRFTLFSRVDFFHFRV